MIQVPISVPWLHRTLRPKYAFTQATPKAGFLDVNFTRANPVWPGMAFMRTSGVAYAQDQPLDVNITPYTNNPLMNQEYIATGAEGAYTLVQNNWASTTAWGIPAGLVGQYIGGDGIDELAQANMNGVAVWVLGPDSEFEVLAPAFDPQLAWATVDPGNGQDVLVYARVKNLTGANLAGLNGQGGPTGTYGLQGQLIFATGNSIDTAPNITTPNQSAATISVQPVGRLLSYNGTMSITIGGLLPRMTGNGWTGGTASPGSI